MLKSECHCFIRAAQKMSQRPAITKVFVMVNESEKILYEFSPGIDTEQIMRSLILVKSNVFEIICTN